MRLGYFEDPCNFYQGLKSLFNSLNIPVNYIDENPLKPQDILSKTYKDSNCAYQLMDDVYILGMVDDKAFESKKSEDISEIRKHEKDYDGILIFGATLKKRENGLLPTRSQLAEITRAFNREFHYTPVVVVFRYEKKYFKDPDAFLEMVNKVVPFLNGGLFECLDDKENKIYINGFSDNMSNINGKANNLVIPDYLFFGKEAKTNLSSDYGVKNKGTKEAAVKGLINILKSYKFTIAENTPIEEDVALDPELLGKVFENLLASYNPETKTTARKQTGSFYTPREIVNYMVDESLIAYLKNSVIVLCQHKNKLCWLIVIDAIVFELYFSDHMKEQKIDILQFVEKDIDEVMQNKEFETLNNTQKEQVITELHNRWSDSNSEIVKRMNSFAEKSPEILKPILEA